MNTNGLIAVAAFTPDLLQAPSAWLGHLPFARWIIQETKPKIFVELGSHYGHSYFAFCQSVVETGILTKCYAVDTWEGDDHAGRYNDEIFNKVNAYNQERYAGFSALLRMTFDDAEKYFVDQSIDLLHIDGLHTYEAVRHDFETWLPKLAPGAIVILHDTNVRERDFGVWKFWEELKDRYPSNLEFLHSYGLGVLQLSNVTNGKNLEWLLLDLADRQQFISYFAALGSRQLERNEISELKKQLDSLNQVLVERDSQIMTLNQSIVERDSQIMTLNQSIVERDSQIIDLNQVVVERDIVISQIFDSTSWRFTYPFRVLISFLRIKFKRNKRT